MIYLDHVKWWFRIDVLVWIKYTERTTKSSYSFKENDRFTTPPQQLHNTPSHGGGAQCVGPTPMWGRCCTVVVVALCRNQIPSFKHCQKNKMRLLTSYKIRSKSLEDHEFKCKVGVTLIHLGERPLVRPKFSVHWVITYSIVETSYSRRNPNPLVKQTIRDFLCDRFNRIIILNPWRRHFNKSY
jgi:hypothetical protein